MLVWQRIVNSMQSLTIYHLFICCGIRYLDPFSTTFPLAKSAFGDLTNLLANVVIYRNTLLDHSESRVPVSLSEVSPIWGVLAILESTRVNILRSKVNTLFYVAPCIFPFHIDAKVQSKHNAGNIAGARSDQSGYIAVVV